MHQINKNKPDENRKYIKKTYTNKNEKRVYYTYRNKMKKVNGMESKGELNAKTKALMNKLTNEPKQLTDKINFIKCISRYMYLYKDDLEILQRALSQLKIYAPISKEEWEEWENDELINQLVEILENVNTYLKKNDNEPFKLLSQPLIEWLDNDGFIMQDTIRMKKDPSLINPKTNMTTIRKFVHNNSYANKQEAAYWFNMLGVSWFSEIDFASFAYASFLNKPRKPLVVSYLSVIHTLANREYLGDEKINYYLNIIKANRNRIGTELDDMYYDLLSSFAQAHKNNKELVKKYDDAIEKYVTNKYGQENRKYYQTLEQIFLRENKLDLYISIIYYNQLKTLENTNFKGKIKHFSSFNIENVLALFNQAGRTDLAKYELDKFIATFDITKSNSEKTKLKYNEILLLTKEPWYQNAKTLSENEYNITKLAQPFQTYISSKS